MTHDKIRERERRGGGEGGGRRECEGLEENREINRQRPEIGGGTDIKQNDMSAEKLAYHTSPRNAGGEIKS